MKRFVRRFFRSMPPKLKVMAHAFYMAVPAAFTAALALKANFAYDIIEHKPELGLYYTLLAAVSAFLLECAFGTSTPPKNGTGNP